MKQFGIWNDQKMRIDNNSEQLYFHEREVWWCRVGVNIGYEQDGKGEEFARPVLIVVKFNKEIFWGIPITTKGKDTRFYEKIYLSDTIDRRVILSQLRLFDKKRLIKKIGSISNHNMSLVKMKIHQLLGGSSSILSLEKSSDEAKAV